MITLMYPQNLDKMPWHFHNWWECASFVMLLMTHEDQMSFQFCDVITECHYDEDDLYMVNVRYPKRPLIVRLLCTKLGTHT